MLYSDQKLNVGKKILSKSLDMLTFCTIYPKYIDLSPIKNKKNVIWNVMSIMNDEINKVCECMKKKFWLIITYYNFIDHDVYSAFEIYSVFMNIIINKLNVFYDMHLNIFYKQNQKIVKRKDQISLENNPKTIDTTVFLIS